MHRHKQMNHPSSNHDSPLYRQYRTEPFPQSHLSQQYDISSHLYEQQTSHQLPNSNILQNSHHRKNSYNQGNSNIDLITEDKNYQPHTTSSVLTVKGQIINLLDKLIELVKELSLTNKMTDRIEDQLQSLAYDVRYEFDQKKGHIVGRGTIIHTEGQVNKDKSYLCFDSPLSILSNNSSANWHLREQGTVSQQQSMAIKRFFQHYNNILDECLSKIDKCEGQKKLKYLVDTVLRQIFSQTMRVSYDCKLLQCKLRRQRQDTIYYNRRMQGRLLLFQLTTLFLSRGNIRKAFHILRSSYWRRIVKQDRLVSSLNDKVIMLADKYIRGRLCTASTALYTWRCAVVRINRQQALTVSHCVEEVVSNIIRSLVANRQHKDQWREIVYYWINMLVQNVVQTNNCLFGTVQSLSRRYLKDIFQSSQHYHTHSLNYSTFRSNVSNQFSQCSNSNISVAYQNSLLSYFTIQQLKQCLASGQILHTKIQPGSLLLVPMQAIAGLVVLALAGDHLHSERQLLTIHKLRLLLKAIEEITPLITQVWDVLQRIQYYNDQLDSQAHLPTLFHQYVSHNTTDNQQSVINRMLKDYCVRYLLVYHVTQSGTITTSPCLNYGDQTIVILLRNIISTIYQQLIQGPKQHLIIQKNNTISYSVLLRGPQGLVGVAHYSFESQQQQQTPPIDIFLMRDCIIPLIIRTEGSIHCHHCQTYIENPQSSILADNICLISPAPHLSLQLQSQPPIPNNPSPQHHNKSSPPNQLSFLDQLHLLTTNTLQQLQDTIITSLQKHIKQQIFFKMFYKTDLNDDSNMHWCISEDGHIQMIPMTAVSQDVVVEEYNHHTNLSHVVVLLASPRFPNAALHIYECGQDHTFKIFRVKLRRTVNRRNLILGEINFAYYYQQDNNISTTLTLTLINQLTQCVSKNTLALKIDQQGLSIINQKTISHNFFEHLTLNMHQLQQNNQGVLTLKNNNVVDIDGKLQTVLAQVGYVSSHQQHFEMAHHLKQPIRRRGQYRQQSLHSLDQALLWHVQLEERNIKELQQLQIRTLRLKGRMQTEYCTILKKLWNNINITSPNTYVLETDQDNCSQSGKIIHLIDVSQSARRRYALIQTDSSWDEDIYEVKMNLLKLHIRTHLAQQAISKASISYANEKNNAIFTILSLLKLSQLPVVKVVKQFEKVLRNKQTAIKNLEIILGSMPAVLSCHQPQPRPNIKHFQLLLVSFQTIFHRSQIVWSRWSRIMQVAIVRVQAVRQRLCKAHALSNIKMFVSKGVHFDCLRACYKIVGFLTGGASCRALSTAFASIKQSVRLSNILKSVSIQTGLQKLFNRLTFKKLQNQHQLFTLCNKLHNQLLSNILQITHQCTRCNFTTLRSFLHFFNNRINKLIKLDIYYAFQRIQIIVGIILHHIDGMMTIVYRHQTHTGNIVESVHFEDPGLANKGFVILTAPYLYFLAYRLERKPTIEHTGKRVEEIAIGQAMQGLIIRCFEQYILGMTSRAKLMEKYLLKVFFKDYSDNSALIIPPILINNDQNLEVRFHKQSFLKRLKGQSWSNNILHLKHTRLNIQTQQSNYQQLQLQHNTIAQCLSSSLTSTPLQHTLDILKDKRMKQQKIINKQNIRQMKKQIEQLQAKQLSTSLAYQLSSKTNAAHRILTYLHKRNCIGGKMLGVLQDGTLLDHKLNVHKLHLAHENRKLVNHNKIFSGCMISLHQLQLKKQQFTLRQSFDLLHLTTISQHPNLKTNRPQIMI